MLNTGFSRLFPFISHSAGSIGPLSEGPDLTISQRGRPTLHRIDRAGTRFQRPFISLFSRSAFQSLAMAAFLGIGHVAHAKTPTQDDHALKGQRQDHNLPAVSKEESGCSDTQIGCAIWGVALFLAYNSWKSTSDRHKKMDKEIQDNRANPQPTPELNTDISDQDAPPRAKQKHHENIPPVQPEIIPAKKMTFDEAMAAVDKELVALPKIKKNLQSLAKFLRWKTLREKHGIVSKKSKCETIILMGPSGTGKTTFAKLCGQIYFSLGLLSKGDVYKIDITHLMGLYIGHSEDRTKALIERARGGVLFLDESYELVKDRSSNDFGNRILTILMQEMSDGEGDLVIALAGYEKEMKELVSKNPGFASRITEILHFENYSAEVLLAIAKQKLDQESLVIDQATTQALKKHFEEITRRKIKDFGNGRYVEKLIKALEKALAERVVSNSSTDNVPLDTLNSISKLDLDRALEILPEIEPTSGKGKRLGF